MNQRMMATIGRSIRHLSFAGLVVSATLTQFASAQSDRRVVIGRAATLTLVFDALAKELPAWHFEQETGGSRFLIRKLVDLRPRMDVLALADAGLFQRGGDGVVNWWIIFARNELVLAYTPRSRFAGEINDRNWCDILLRTGVNSGYANPNLDPEGYNTLIAWKLAERYYKRPGLYAQLLRAVPASNIRDHSVALLALLESGELDYSWQYLSVARQHGLRFIQLPGEINLGDSSLAAEYAAVSVELAGNAPGRTIEQRGEPIEYGVSIPTTAVNLEGAQDFIARLLSAGGREVLRANYQSAVVPGIMRGQRDAVPTALRRLVE